MRFAYLPLLLSAFPSSLFSEIVLRENGILVDNSLEKKAAGSALESDPAGDDVLLFQNGDVMHGTFGGLKGGIIWERKDIERPIRFGLPSVRQVVRKAGQILHLHRFSHRYVELQNRL